MRLELEHLQVRVGGATVIRDLDLVLPDGELGCLLGPSGSGKTSILRAIAGLAPIADGVIRVGGRVLSGAGQAVAPARRGVGMVFQDLALLPHLSVADNVAFGIARRPAAERARRVAAILELAGLTELATRRPHQLSGGQQQRVAVARALAPAPGLLLLDEPFSGLDAEQRLVMAQQLRGLVVGAGTTALMVTHDQREALGIGDRVGVLHAGALQQWAPPVEVHERPANRFVAGFVGDGVLLPGQADADGVDTELGRLPAPPGGPRGAVEVLLRPSRLCVDGEAGPDRTGIVEHRLYRGGDCLYRVRLPSGRDVQLIGNADSAVVGERIGVGLRAHVPVLFAAP